MMTSEKWIHADRISLNLKKIQIPSERNEQVRPLYNRIFQSRDIAQFRINQLLSWIGILTRRRSSQTRNCEGETIYPQRCIKRTTSDRLGEDLCTYRNCSWTSGNGDLVCIVAGFTVCPRYLFSKLTFKSNHSPRVFQLMQPTTC